MPFSAKFFGAFAPQGFLGSEAEFFDGGPVFERFVGGVKEMRRIQHHRLPHLPALEGDLGGGVAQADGQFVGLGGANLKGEMRARGRFPFLGVNFMG